MTVVTYVHRPKRAARKRKAQAAAITVPTIVQSISRKQARLTAYARRHRPAEASK